jgi:hypothetical protein
MKVIKFNEILLLEAKSGYFSFIYNGKPYRFEETSKKNIFIKVVEWLYKNNYEFEDVKIFNSVPAGHRTDHYHNISGTNRFIDINFIKQYQGLISMLNNFGVDKNSISFGEIESTNSTEKTDEPMEKPSDFIKTTEKPKEYVKNPFMQSICVLGKSGAGKSWTIDEILSEESNHEYEFIIPSASTTGLLSQFSPSAKEGRGGYIPSRLGKMIEKAYKNNNTFYTAVFDECHKSNIIEMINDELLQAISTERNKNRFISLDDETSDLYPSKVLDKRGNIEITDNLGFIFISSNARVISGNDDFFNRVDLVEITKESRKSVKTIDDLNKLRISDTDKKYELVSKIMSETKR